MPDPILKFTDGVFGDGDYDHHVFDGLLHRYVAASADGVNRVDYAAWKASRGDLEDLRRYITDLQALLPATLTRPARFAFWVNLYNAETLRVVLEAYPVRSIFQVRSSVLPIGPWWRKSLQVNGVKLSLHDIENRVLRPGFADPRLHYALNCASTGCPVLRPKAWSALNLDDELDQAARTMINHARGVRLKNGRLVLSRIFKWYRKDFGGSDQQILAHLEAFAEPELAKDIAKHKSIGGYEYDWSLNGRGAGKGS